jgi:type II secretory pathway pseudopilin PulG
MDFRARKTTPEEDGFILIEVLVSALILAIVAGAVLTLITATTRGAAVQRDRAVAYDLAQEDQARLRTLKLTEISGVETKYQEPAPVVNGTEYEVKSERVFVNNKLGAVTCASETAKPDYVQLTSTVSSNSMLHPVVLQSVVSPSSGSLDSKNKTLTIKTANALGEPVSGVSVTASSTAAGTRSAASGGEGCANFVSLPEGKYKVIYSSTSLVNPKGESQSTEEFSLEGGGYQTQPTSSWDHPATLQPEFVYLQPGTGTQVSAAVDSMYVNNATNGVSLAVGTPGGARSSILAKKVFPFKSPGEYTVYAGYCSSNNPGTSTANRVGLFSGLAAPEAILKPQIHVPALELTVTTKSGREGKEGTELVVAGAKVTLTDRNCKYNGSNVKRTYMTNSGGHLANEAAVKEELATKEPKAPTEAGMPFGAYEICASATINGEARYAKVTEQKVEDFTSKGTVLKVNLQKATAC